MDRAEVIARLKSAEPDLRARGVAGLYLFGSYSRKEQRPDSDIDLFIDKHPGRRFGFSALTGSYRLLQQVLPGIPISFGTREGLSRHIRGVVEREAVKIF